MKLTSSFIIGIGFFLVTVSISTALYLTKEPTKPPVDPEYYYTDEFISQVQPRSTCRENDTRKGCDPANATTIYIDCDYQFTQAPENWGGQTYTEEMIYHNTKKCESLKKYIGSEVEIDTSTDINDPNIEAYIRINFIPYEDFEQNIGKSKVTIFHISKSIEGPYEGYGGIFVRDGIEIWGGYWHHEIDDIRLAIGEYRRDINDF